MLVTIAIAFLTTCSRQISLPDNAAALWTRAYYTWQIVGDQPSRGDDLRSVTERRADLGKSFRKFAALAIPMVQDQIDDRKKYIKDNENSLDPEVQDIVKSSRTHLADKERDLKWYQGLLKVSDQGKIYLPK